MGKKGLVLAGVLLLVLVSLFGCAHTPVCGNQICETGENNSNCADDCNSPSAVAQVALCMAPYGEDIYTAGYVNGVCADCSIKGAVGGNNDTCITNIAGEGRRPVEESSTLLKFYCTNEGWARKEVTCKYGCLKGACIKK